MPASLYASPCSISTCLQSSEVNTSKHADCVWALLCSGQAAQHQQAAISDSSGFNTPGRHSASASPAAPRMAPSIRPALPPRVAGRRHQDLIHGYRYDANKGNPKWRVELWNQVSSRLHHPVLSAEAVHVCMPLQVIKCRYLPLEAATLDCYSCWPLLI